MKQIVENTRREWINRESKPCGQSLVHETRRVKWKLVWTNAKDTREEIVVTMASYVDALKSCHTIFFPVTSPKLQWRRIYRY